MAPKHSGLTNKNRAPESMPRVGYLSMGPESNQGWVPLNCPEHHNRAKSWKIYKRVKVTKQRTNYAKITPADVCLSHLEEGITGWL